MRGAYDNVARDLGHDRPQAAQITKIMSLFG